MYRISSDWKVEEVTCHNAGILKPGNGLAGIRHLATILCAFPFMVNALTYRIFLLWSSRIRSENLPSVDSSTLKFSLMPTSHLRLSQLCEV